MYDEWEFDQELCRAFEEAVREQDGRYVVAEPIPLPREAKFPLWELHHTACDCGATGWFACAQNDE